ncbi:2-hydroxyacid dehydrogenase [Anaerobacillus sp. MEB173]|uniref:2-hydroxyacid dehydrogenase n=1 Tax=Anaerobacillus sp. MEB173 TaxID=3383345 RepID=UPI003F92D11E
MKPKVIVYKKISEETKRYIENYCQVTYFEDETPDLLRGKQRFIEELKDAKGLLGSSLVIDHDLLDKAPQLKIVSNTSAGYNNFDLTELSRRKIMATNTPDVLTDTTADTIFGLLLATAKRIPELDQFVKNNEWNNKIDESRYGVDVHHKVLGIIGMGRIGSAIAKRASLGFDMKVLYNNRTRNEFSEKSYGAVYCELDELLKVSDFVCVMAPLTEKTKNSIGIKQFKLMKESAILIVGSRGGIVNEKELINALLEGDILAAGCDVYENEPLNGNNPLLSMKNVVTLPHVGSATRETRLAMDTLAAENLVKGLTGERPPSIINDEILNELS